MLAANTFTLPVRAGCGVVLGKRSCSPSVEDCCSWPVAWQSTPHAWVGRSPGPMCESQGCSRALCDPELVTHPLCASVCEL